MRKLHFSINADVLYSSSVIPSPMLAGTCSLAFVVVGRMITLQHMKASNEAWCRLCIDTKDHHPEIVTQQTGITYTTIQVKGSQYITPTTLRVIPGKVHQHNLWMYNTPKEIGESSLYIEKSIAMLLSVLDKRKDSVKEILTTYSDRILTCFAYVSDAHIYFSLSAETLAKLNEYGLSVEFDVYSLTDKG